MGYSPWGHKRLDMTEQLSMHNYKVSIWDFQLSLELGFLSLTRTLSLWVS